jgi:hypothetical protein
MKKLNKAQKIEKMLSAGATVAEVVEKLKVARGYVYLVKQKMKPVTNLATNDRFHNAVKLTATQTALANKLGISKEAYARELVKMPKRVKDITAVGTELGGLVLTSPEKGKYRWARKDPVDTPDMVNHPPHYKVGGIEVIDFIEAKQLGYNLGNVVKYVSRSGRKGTDAIQDLQKARWYLERAIQRAE